MGNAIVERFSSQFWLLFLRRSEMRIKIYCFDMTGKLI